MIKRLHPIKLCRWISKDGRASPHNHLYRSGNYWGVIIYLYKGMVFIIEEEFFNHNNYVDFSNYHLIFYVMDQ